MDERGQPGWHVLVGADVPGGAVRARLPVPVEAAIGQGHALVDGDGRSRDQVQVGAGRVHEQSRRGRGHVGLHLGLGVVALLSRPPSARLFLITAPVVPGKRYSIASG